MAAGEIVRGLWSERWAHWKLKSERARGKSAAALATLEDAERRMRRALHSACWVATCIARPGVTKKPRPS